MGNVCKHAQMEHTSVICNVWNVLTNASSVGLYLRVTLVLYTAKNVRRACSWTPVLLANAPPNAKQPSILIPTQEIAMHVKVHAKLVIRQLPAIPAYKIISYTRMIVLKELSVQRILSNMSTHPLILSHALINVFHPISATVSTDSVCYHVLITTWNSHQMPYVSSNVHPATTSPLTYSAYNAQKPAKICSKCK